MCGVSVVVWLARLFGLVVSIFGGLSVGPLSNILLICFVFAVCLGVLCNRLYFWCVLVVGLIVWLGSSFGLVVGRLVGCLGACKVL